MGVRRTAGARLNSCYTQVTPSRVIHVCLRVFACHPCIRLCPVLFQVLVVSLLCLLLPSIFPSFPGTWGKPPWDVSVTKYKDIGFMWGLGCHCTLQGRGLLKSHGLSETPIVWRNTSDTFTPSLSRDYYEFNSFRLWAVNQFVLKKKVMVDAVPVLADNPCGTVLVLVSLYLVPKKTSGETQQSL